MSDFPTQKETIAAFVRLKKDLVSLPSEIVEAACADNPWFSPAYVQHAASAVATWLMKEKLEAFVAPYPFPAQGQVGLVTAGNLPLVGFHDILCVLLSGAALALQPSRRDSVLMDFVIKKLCEYAPNLQAQISTHRTLPAHVDRLICTGSNQAVKHYKALFPKIPTLIRQNRTSVAILQDQMTEADLIGLANDVHLYNGLGCRNVSILLSVNHNNIFQLAVWNDLPNLYVHTRYTHKYQREKARLDWLGLDYATYGASLIVPTDAFAPPPMSILHHKQFPHMADLNDFILRNQAKIQTVVGRETAYGQSQYPALGDFADGWNTLEFLFSPS